MNNNLDLSSLPQQLVDELRDYRGYKKRTNTGVLAVLDNSFKSVDQILIAVWHKEKRVLSRRHVYTALSQGTRAGVVTCRKVKGSYTEYKLVLPKNSEEPK